MAVECCGNIPEIIRYVASLLFTVACAKDYVVDVPGLGSLRGSDARPAVPGKKSQPVFPGVAQFSGIPYAKAPVGPLRWQIPQAPEPWQGVRDATKYQPLCYEVGSIGSTPPQVVMSEDCLFLNLAAPITSLRSTSQLPVMMWIHGGSDTAGDGDHQSLDALVAGSNYSVLVASVNYRLNIFGFLGSWAIKKRTTDGSAGNFGIQDQRMAMIWLRDHAVVFGGNGADITIFGQSAGGMNVFDHLTQPASFSLYKRSIIQSGAYSTSGVTMDQAEHTYASVLNETGCSDLECLLALDAESLLSKGFMQGHVGSVIDGVSITTSPIDIVQKGQHNVNVSIIIGSVRDEVASPWWSEKLPKDMNETIFDAFWQYGFPPLGIPSLGDQGLKKLKQIYDPAFYVFPSNLGNYSIWWWTHARASTDMVPGLGPCGARSLARSFLAGGSTNVYAYMFGLAPQSPDPYCPGPGPGNVISPHSAEIPFVFGDTTMMVPDNEKDLAKTMSTYWHSFARHGVPAGASLPSWPLYTQKDDAVLRFDDALSAGGIYVQHCLRKAACDFWDARAASAPSGVIVV